MGITLKESDISACHTLPSKKTIPNIVIRFTNRKIKNNILRHGRDLKGSSIYINEHLASKNSKTAATARQLRKDKRILNTRTKNCKVFIKMIGTGKGSQVRVIRELEDFRTLSLT